MKKGIYINQIIRNIVIIAFLTYILSKNTGLATFMICSFIICLFLSTMKYIFLVFNKDKYANIFSKLYLIVFLSLAFCFMSFWSYIVIKNNNYSTLLFTIPFWITWICLVKKYLFKNKEKTLFNKIKLNFNIEKFITYFLVLSVLLIGFICLFIGIRDSYNVSKKTKNYLTTTGYFKDYEVFDSSESYNHNRTETHTTYRLFYTYKVNGKEYTIKTDYGNGYIPDLNSTRKIKYNPNNPSEAVLVGMNRNNGLIYFGAFFTLGGMVFVLIFLQIKGVFDKFKIDVIGAYIGIVFTIIGIGIILLQNGMTSSFIEMVKVMKFWILIPLLFIGVGILLTIRSLFLPKLQMNTKKEK